MPLVSTPSRPTQRIAPPPGAAGTSEALVALGTDFLLFLVATVLVIPVFKSAKQSPVLGYLFAGVVILSALGVITSAFLP